jgi:hypothetical protein
MSEYPPENSAKTGAIEFLSGDAGEAAGSESTQNPAPAISATSDPAPRYPTPVRRFRFCDVGARQARSPTMNPFHSLLLVIGEIALGLSVLVFVEAALAAYSEKFRSGKR